MLMRIGEFFCVVQILTPPLRSSPSKGTFEKFEILTLPMRTSATNTCQVLILFAQICLIRCSSLFKGSARRAMGFFHKKHTPHLPFPAIIAHQRAIELHVPS